MDYDRFWDLVERHVGRRGSELDPRPLVKALEKLPPDEIADFDVLFRTLHARSFSHALWGAAYLIKRGCSDDGFDYFRSWLIGMGRRVFEDALANPDSLVTVADTDVECEELMYVASEAYELATQGRELLQPSLEFPAPGDDFDFDQPQEMQRRYPRLYAKFG